MKKKSTLSSLISIFSRAVSQARSENEQILWSRNSLEDIKNRKNHEVREQTLRDGDTTIIVHELWKKIDSIAVHITPQIETERIE